MTHNGAAGRIVLIGSGEIGPSMAPTHRALVASLPPRDTAPSLVALDGSYDFQTNRAEMGEKIAVFFRSKVGVATTVVGLPETERPGADLAPPHSPQRSPHLMRRACSSSGPVRRRAPSSAGLEHRSLIVLLRASVQAQR